MTSQSAGESEVVEFKVGGQLRGKGGAGRGRCDCKVNSKTLTLVEPHQAASESQILSVFSIEYFIKTMKRFAAHC